MPWCPSGTNSPTSLQWTPSLKIFKSRWWGPSGCRYNELLDSQSATSPILTLECPTLLYHPIVSLWPCVIKTWTGKETQVWPAHLGGGTQQFYTTSFQHYGRHRSYCNCGFQEDCIDDRWQDKPILYINHLSNHVQIDLITLFYNYMLAWIPITVNKQKISKPIWCWPCPNWG